MRRGVAALAATAALSGCGGEDEFAARAAAICTERQAEIDKIRPPGALILFEDYLKNVLPMLREQHREVAALDGAGSGDAEAMVEAWREVLAALEDMSVGAQAGSDVRILINRRRAVAAEQEADEAARAAGAAACVGFNPLTPRA